MKMTAQIMIENSKREIVDAMTRLEYNPHDELSWVAAPLFKASYRIEMIQIMQSILEDAGGIEARKQLTLRITGFYFNSSTCPIKVAESKWRFEILKDLLGSFEYIFLN